MDFARHRPSVVETLHPAATRLLIVCPFSGNTNYCMSKGLDEARRHRSGMSAGIVWTAFLHSPASLGSLGGVLSAGGLSEGSRRRRETVRDGAMAGTFVRYGPLLISGLVYGLSFVSHAIPYVRQIHARVRHRMNQLTQAHIAYFSDVLCIWAYTAQIRVDELRRQYSDRIQLSYHFVPVFGCTAHRIGEGWKEKGGFEGFGQHMQSVCEQFHHVELNKRIWRGEVPASSSSCHHFIKSVQLLEQKGVIDHKGHEEFEGRSLFEELLWRTRLAFFRDARNVADLSCLFDLSDELELPADRIRAQLENGEAMAALCRDVELRDEFKVEGSPSYVLNEGRQKLYGNVGYMAIAANVEELLNRPAGQASWC